VDIPHPGRHFFDIAEPSHAAAEAGAQSRFGPEQREQRMSSGRSEKSTCTSSDQQANASVRLRTDKATSTQNTAMTLKTAVCFGL
jgi:hypothetical protein